LQGGEKFKLGRVLMKIVEINGVAPGDNDEIQEDGE
jgi:hypothetical protein